MVETRLRKGQTLDGFLIGDLIHEGGMATLRQVTHPDIDFPILMKVPRLLEGMDPAAIVGFEMEQMILPRLSGVHVPRFVAAGDFAVQPYIVMEQIPGPSLLPLRERLPLPPEEVAALGAKIATALHDLHHQHVVHLDVKPSNILIRPTGEAVLVDFGLARHDQLPDLMEEQFRIPYGTGPYMAPEQILGIRRDPRSDLFALGVLLYFFSTGVRPFGDPKGKRRLQKRLWRDPVPPRKLRADFPPWLQEVVLRCLEVDPARRHPTAAQLAMDLTNPDQIKLTARSDRLKRDPWSAVLRRRFQPPESRPALKHAVAAQISTAPILAVALDVTEGSDELAEAIRVTVRRILEIVPGARLACLNVLKQRRLALDQKLDEEGRNKHVERLVELKHWARPLGIAEERITFHVLEAVDTPAAILEYARTNNVDHIVLGARTNSTLRNILGSVSGEVAARAPCSVTVVRPPRSSDDSEPETSA
ncbi:MAG TPA: bifunctional serine/threonine-protein kinase/universal stress protein [Thermoanaerobaculia bacterium]|nr:bifunctional serine/threonine-protein kinase/universal stress protein [Thermoanaerobaculia bacterium]HQR68514.1 bifunctional serine/threonine-protein kinase/universal stress protein [Thermoanaerobaculia bacterium]